MPRLFFALWPDDATRTTLASAAAALDVREGRRVRPENLHLTLRYLGPVDAARVSALCETLAVAAMPAFEFELAHAGWWRGTRVAWLAPLAPPPALMVLVDALTDGLVPLGYAAEARCYRPHVTIARGVRRAPRATGPLSVRWPVADFALVESRTDPRGACYEVLRSWPLGGDTVD